MKSILASVTRYMEQQDADFLQEMEQLLDQHDYALPEVGDIRTGIIVSITPQGVIVDLGLKRDGIVQPADLDKLPAGERESMKVNDEIAVYILSTDQPDSLYVSRHMALLNQDWIRAEQMLESQEIFESEVVGYNRGGALVDFGGLRGFIPSSHLSMLSANLNDRQRQQRLSKLRGEIIPLRVIEVDRRQRRLVLSQRDAEKVWLEARRKELMSKIDVGSVLPGRVSGWRDFGAFVDLGGVDGLIHVSELAWYRVNHPREVVKIGEELEVYVLKIDREKGRISLSRKKLLPNPWSLVEENYPVGNLVEGKIIRIVDYGAFVELEPGVEGLLHTSQISRATVNNPREVVSEGETHLLRVISVDAKRERIGLSLKAVTAREQIDWMTQRELAAAAAAAAAAEKQAEEAPAGAGEAPEAVEVMDTAAPEVVELPETVEAISSPEPEVVEEPETVEEVADAATVVADDTAEEPAGSESPADTGTGAEEEADTPAEDAVASPELDES